MHACIYTREKSKITVSVCFSSSHNLAINKVRKCWKRKVRSEVPNEKTHLSCSILFQFFKDSKSEGQSSFRTIEKKTGQIQFLKNFWFNHQSHHSVLSHFYKLSQISRFHDQHFELFQWHLKTQTQKPILRRNHDQTSSDVNQLLGDRTYPR